jgi:hypothetical protein
MEKRYNNGACRKCESIEGKRCEFLKSVRYTDDTEPYVLQECIDPRTSYWFENCPKGLEEWERT